MSCEKETLEHKQMVSHFMNVLIKELISRAESMKKTVATEEFHEHKKEGWKKFQEKASGARWITITNGIKNSRILSYPNQELILPAGWRVGYTENRCRCKKEKLI